MASERDLRMYRVVICMNYMGFLETLLTFEVPTSVILLLFSIVRREENLLVIPVCICYILKYLEDRNAW